MPCASLPHAPIHRGASGAFLQQELARCPPWWAFTQAAREVDVVEGLDRLRPKARASPPSASAPPPRLQADRLLGAAPALPAPTNLWPSLATTTG